MPDLVISHSRECHKVNVYFDEDILKGVVPADWGGAKNLRGRLTLADNGYWMLEFKVGPPGVRHRNTGWYTISDMRGNTMDYDLRLQITVPKSFSEKWAKFGMQEIEILKREKHLILIVPMKFFLGTPPVKAVEVQAMPTPPGLVPTTTPGNGEEQEPAPKPQMGSLFDELINARDRLNTMVELFPTVNLAIDDGGKVVINL